MCTEEFPSPGDMVITPHGDGKVVSTNYVKKTLLVKLDDSGKRSFLLRKSTRIQIKFYLWRSRRFNVWKKTEK